MIQTFSSWVILSDSQSQAESPNQHHYSLYKAPHRVHTSGLLGVPTDWQCFDLIILILELLRLVRTYDT